MRNIFWTYFGYPLIATMTLALITTATISPANSQEKLIRVEFLMSLTDPDTNNSWYAVRVSRITWPTMDTCKTQGQKLIQNHIAAVEGFGLFNRNRKPPVVKVESWHCVD